MSDESGTCGERMEEDKGWRGRRGGEGEGGQQCHNDTMTFSCMLQYCVCKFQKSVCAVAGHYM